MGYAITSMTQLMISGAKFKHIVCMHKPDLATSDGGAAASTDTTTTDTSTNRMLGKQCCAGDSPIFAYRILSVVRALSVCSAVHSSGYLSLCNLV